MFKRFGASRFKAELTSPLLDDTDAPGYSNAVPGQETLAALRVTNRTH